MIRMERYKGASAQRHKSSVKAIYESAWADMPFPFDDTQLRNFVQTFEQHSERADFRLCTATDNRRMVGFAYGYGSKPGGWWREHVQKGLDRRSARAWLGDAFEVAEVAVARESQGQGIGTRLLDSLLGGLPHRTAVLSTQRDNRRAVAFYEKRGWRVIVDDLQFPHRQEPFIVMGLDLRVHASLKAAQENAPVVVVGYDPTWPATFQQEHDRLLPELVECSARIEHIGSTAVPGLSAKPTIDIMVGVHRLSDARPCIARLESLGYDYLPEFEAVMPERRYFRLRSKTASFNLHMVEQDGEFWKRHLAFRDHLRANPQVAEEYERLKRDLATHYASDREAYQSAKSAFIRSVEAAALHSA
jgi:GrpB-like predicted nucleotidyltransferase (UPF0157 family)/ribosomal protein S18 acetylase RimI-like enzyme